MAIKLTQDEFIQKAISKHNNIYYYNNVIYYNSKIKVKIICKEHGIFEQVANYHLTGSGCVKCKLGGKSSTNKFIESASNIHNYKYDYRLVKYINCYTKVNIMCGCHGTFSQRPANHLKGEGCPKCNLSKGELKVSKYLESNLIEYEIQKKFNNCFSNKKKKLPFDFYLPEQNICIEYDGEQHFRPIDYFGGVKSFNELKQRDSIKDKYCLENNIKLIRIPFNKYDMINDILNNIMLE